MKQNVRATERVAVILFLIVLLMVVYQNCAVPSRVDPALMQKLAQANLEVLQSLEVKEKKAVCETPEFYTCGHKVFNPETSSTFESSYTKCIGLAGVAEPFCVQVQAADYGTRDTLANCTTCTLADSAPGGQYNFEQVTCYNHLIRVADRFPVQVQGRVLEDSVINVLGLCRQVLNY